MATISIGVRSTNAAVREIIYDHFLGEVSRIPGCDLVTGDRGEARARMSGLELVAAIITSAAATHLAIAVREAVKKHRLEMELKHENGTVLMISASGDIPVEEITKFVMSKG